MQSSLFLKFGALASALLLGAAFVSYRAGGFDRSGRPDRPAADPPRAQAVQSAVPSGPRRPQAVPQSQSVPDRGIFSSSKSGRVFVESPPAPAAPPQAAPPDQPAVIMTGSKSLMPAAPRQEAVQSFQKAGKR